MSYLIQIFREWIEFLLHQLKGEKLYRTLHTKYNQPTEKIKHNFMISEINVFDQTVNNDRKTVYTLD